MNKRTQLLKVMMFNLLVWTQMQGMDTDSSFTEEEKALQALEDGTGNPYRFGPIAIDRITAQDLADIEDLKERYSRYLMTFDIRTYVEKRTLMAKAGRQRWYDKFMDWDCNEPDRYKPLIDKIFEAALSREDLPLAKDLFKHGAYPNERIARGPFLGVRTVPMLDLLISHGVDIDKTGCNLPIVHNAVAYDSPKFLERLLQCPGVNVNARSNPGRMKDVFEWRQDFEDTPLHVWAKLCPWESRFPGIQKKLMILIRAGADVTLKNSKNHTALDILRSHIADRTYCVMLRELADQLAALMPPQPQADIARKAVVATEESACVICLENFQQSDDRTTLPCAHVFHTACVNPWIASNRTCPTCRTAI